MSYCARDKLITSVCYTQGTSRDINSNGIYPLMVNHHFITRPLHPMHSTRLRPLPPAPLYTLLANFCYYLQYSPKKGTATTTVANTIPL